MDKLKKPKGNGQGIVLPKVVLIVAVTLFVISCKQTTVERTTTNDTEKKVRFEDEKAAILATINNETKAAFTRDYEGWKDKWVHAPYVAKTYMELPDSTMSESLGWQSIDDFVMAYFQAHPEPDPIPTLVDDISVRLYENGAWVSFEQHDAERGLKRETRLMEKVDGQWKIAGMHTTIYGFKTSE
ncbi:hypothetical protein [uncultured Croceitalea sp.]|uniref:hypothetical protein n=1 Tax=uncultured Croceitalea sp. TaxID=1798908 RepID=UPI003305FB72